MTYDLLITDSHVITPKGMVEKNIVEGVFNNVVGTYNLALCANNYAVENMVLISTDKAVRPTNVMGASKRFSELILQALNSEKTKTCFRTLFFSEKIKGNHYYPYIFFFGALLGGIF